MTRFFEIMPDAIAETGGIHAAPTDSPDTDCRGRIHASRIASDGKRPDLRVPIGNPRHTSDTIALKAAHGKKAKPITKPRTKPELGI